MSENSIRSDEIIEQVGQAYDRLFMDGDIEQARRSFIDLSDAIESALRGAMEQADRIDVLHLLANLGADLGQKEQVKRAAGELARIFEPEDEEDMEALLDDMLSEWWCPDAARLLVERLEGQLDRDYLEHARSLVFDAMEELALAPLKTEQILDLRSHLMDCGVLVEEEDGFLLEENEDDPLKHTRAWLDAQGSDVEDCLDFIMEEGGCSSDVEVLLSLPCMGIYDGLANWKVEAPVRRYQMLEEDDALDIREQWVSESPDGRFVSVFDDVGDAAYFYVYRQADESLAAPPLWLYNRKPAPTATGAKPMPEESAPLMPERFMVDPKARKESPASLEIQWTEDSQRTAVSVEGSLMGFVDIAARKGFSQNLKAETEVGSPWPKDTPWEAGASVQGDSSGDMCR